MLPALGTLVTLATFATLATIHLLRLLEYICYTSYFSLPRLFATLLDLAMPATRAMLSEVAALAAFNRWYQKTILSQTLDIVSPFISLFYLG